MSMAQTRDRSKWAQDPRNTFWANDSDKYGQRMLQKMGWSEGKGLGTDGQGSTEHIKVKKKSNLLGIGATIDNDYNWLAAQDAFSDVLAGLNDAVKSGQVGEGAPAAAAAAPAGESKPKVTQRQKMLYSRFRKSKDLSHYSQNDLGCILGHNELRPERFKEKDEAATDDSAAPKEAVTSVQTVVRKESVADYFAAKLAAKLKAASGGASTSATASESVSVASESASEKAEAEAEEAVEAKTSKKKSKKDKKDKKAKREEDAGDEAEPVQAPKDKGEKRKHEQEREIDTQEDKKKGKKDKKDKKHKKN